MEVYLDNSATTRQYDEVTDLMTKVMKEDYGNPSSLHRRGLAVTELVKEAGKKLAKAANVSTDEIIFTSGGTEADNMAITGTAEKMKRSGKKIITTKIEHPAVLEPAKVLEERGYEVVYIDVDNRGFIDMKQLKDEITHDTILISVMHVNNEVGTIEPIEEIAAIKGNAILHVDAVQSFGKIPLPQRGVDLISISGHKVHGPKGIGALIMKDSRKIKPIIVGGGQERNLRSGTENTPGIIGFGLAAEIATKDLKTKGDKVNSVKEYLSNRIKEEIPDVKFFSPEESLPFILNVSFLGTRGEVILHTLESEGIYVSTGSACSSHKNGGSHVLKAMGASQKEIEGALRFSFNEFNTREEMDYVADKLKQATDKFRRLGSFR